jgi:glutamyl-tRNA synthetase
VPENHGVRTRFAPAPSGEIHVGGARTALFSWAAARRVGGTFVLRVEDTDRSRVLDVYVDALLEDLRWLGLHWDEGPIRQSDRGEVYADAIARLLDGGAAYRAFDTPEELAAQREEAQRRKVAWRYDGSTWKALSRSKSDALAAEGRSFVVRFAMPPGETTFTDLVRGDVRVDHAEIGDFALTRADGAPLYYLAATVDDVLMELTHIVRGEDLLMATPRQLAMYTALGYPRERWPVFAHVPLIVGADGKPLSKRHGDTSLGAFRRAGILPEAMLNYLAQLGWSMPDGRERFTAAEFVAEFSLDRVQRSTAQFDVRKLEALNGEWIRSLDPTDLQQRVAAVLTEAGVVHDDDRLARAVPELASRLRRLTEAVDLLNPVFAAPGDFAVDPADAAVLTGDVRVQVETSLDVLAAVEPFEPEPIIAALRAALIEGHGLKPKTAFGPLYVAVTGRRSGFPLNHVMALIGRDETLRRLGDALVRVDRA